MSEAIAVVRVYVQVGDGPHECVGDTEIHEETAITAVPSLLRALAEECERALEAAITAEAGA